MPQRRYLPFSEGSLGAHCRVSEAATTNFRLKGSSVSVLKVTPGDRGWGRKFRSEAPREPRQELRWWLEIDQEQ